MTTSKKVLTKWRKESLRKINSLEKMIPGSLSTTTGDQIAINERILTLTQELIDQHLLKEAKHGS